MTDFLGKKYKLESNHNLDEYLKAIGVGAVLRKVATSLSISFSVVEKDGVFTMTVVTPLKTKKYVFKSGVEFEDEFEDKRKAMSVIVMEKARMVHTLRNKEGQTSEIVRSFSNTGVDVVLKYEGVVATRKLKLVQ